MPNPQLEFLALTTDSQPSIPIADVPVHAGFPCPVDDAYMSQPIFYASTSEGGLQRLCVTSYADDERANAIYGDVKCNFWQGCA